MPWFKVDDKLHDHRKARAAGKAAMGVWVLAGSWAADNLTDGFVPTSILTRWGTRADARRLVSVGLWYEDTQDGEAGWRYHEWDERQPTRAQKLAEREAKAQAGRAGGFASGRSRRQAKTKQSASHVVEAVGVELPTRPDPNLPTTSGEIALRDDSQTAQTLVGEWIDHCDDRPPSRVIGQVAREVKTLLDEGIDYDRVRRALAEWNRKGLHPSTLATVVHEIANRAPGVKGQQATNDLFDRAMERAIEAERAS